MKEGRNRKKGEVKEKAMENETVESDTKEY